MKTSWRGWIFGTLSLAALCTLWVLPGRSVHTPQPLEVTHHIPRPPPTENWLEDIAEGVQKKNRKAWFKELHRTGPGVDY